tara:strand:+ start:323 stop:880 length:558 start_codon:yes stop_codon:yes gene_type:complete
MDRREDVSTFRQLDYDTFDAIAKQRAIAVLPEISRQYYGRDYYVTERPEDYGWDLEIRDRQSDRLVCYCDAKVKRVWRGATWPEHWKYIHVEPRLRDVIHNQGFDPVEDDKRVTLCYFNYELTALILITNLQDPMFWREVSNNRERKGEWFYHYEVRGKTLDRDDKSDGLNAHFHNLNVAGETNG